MRKDCHTCKHELFDKCCNDCLYGDPPSNWEAASYYVPDTNAEKIRSMSDEQLAASYYIPCPYDDGGYGECKFGWHKREQTCEECKLEWLRMPSKE